MGKINEIKRFEIVIMIVLLILAFVMPVSANLNVDKEKNENNIEEKQVITTIPINYTSITSVESTIEKISHSKK